MLDLTDEALVERAKANDQDAYTELYRRIIPRISAMIRRVLFKVPDEAEDCIQITASKIFLGIDSFEGRSKFQTWCGRIAINEAVMALRKLTAPTRPDRLGNVIYFDHSNDDLVQIEPVWEDPEFNAILARADLDKVLPHIAPGYRRVIQDRYIDGYEHNEIAAMRGCSIGAAKSQRFHAVAACRRAFQNLEK
jgi:RNA polymerase sigma-70 factor, ECF subfamily